MRRGPQRKRNRRTAWQRAEAAGLDMSLVEVNMRLSPMERVRQHNRALNLALELRAAMKKRDG